jgi:hypothetical protein
MFRTYVFWRRLFGGDRRPNTMDRTTEDARAVLRAAQEIHSGRHGAHTFTLGTNLPLQAARRRTGLRPNSIRYYDAIKELEYEGAIEWPTSARYARGNKRYVITKRGLVMLGEAKSGAVSK